MTMPHEPKANKSFSRAALLTFFLVFALIMTLLLVFTQAAAAPKGEFSTSIAKQNEDEEEEEEWSSQTVVDAVKEDNTLITFGIVGILSLLISLPVTRSIAKTRQVEDAIPNILTEVAGSIRSANSVESSFRDVAAVMDNYPGRLLQKTCLLMNETSFNEAMKQFAKDSKSLAVERIVSLINIAIESGASIADVLDKISEELFDVYSLRTERENKSATNAMVILWGGILFTAVVIGGMLGLFGGNIAGGTEEETDPNQPGGTQQDDSGDDAEESLQDAQDIIKIFLLGLALECAFMHGVAMGTLKIDMLRVPFYMFLAIFTYVVSLHGAPAFAP